MKSMLIGSSLAVMIVFQGAGCSKSTDDATVSQNFVGTWKALDTGNKTLHLRDEAVASETVVVCADGTLRYNLTLEAEPDHPQTDHWKWQIRDGKLLLRFVNQGQPGDWLPPLHLKVSSDRLTISRKNFPDKQFVRIPEQASSTP